MARDTWYRLDSVGKLYSAQAGNSFQTVFRFSATLADEVDEQILQHAVEKAVSIFPSFNVCLRSGMFWHYLERAAVPPVVSVENLPICYGLHVDTKSVLFRVSYYHDRINLEVSHMVSDGRGTINFLKALLNAYAQERYGVGAVPLDYDGSDHQKSENSFNKYYERVRAEQARAAKDNVERVRAEQARAGRAGVERTGSEQIGLERTRAGRSWSEWTGPRQAGPGHDGAEQAGQVQVGSEEEAGPAPSPANGGRGSGKAPSRKKPKVYRLSGWHDVADSTYMEYHLPAQSVKGLARSHGVSVTSLVIAAIMCAIREEMPVRYRHRTIRIDIPVDLRQMFTSATTGNFYGMTYVSYTPKENDPVEQVAKLVHDQLKVAARPEHIMPSMNRLIGLEKNPFLRFAPLFVKDLVLEWTRRLVAREATTTVSNLGRIQLDERISPYVRNINVLTSTTGLNFTLCSFGDDMSIGISTIYQNLEIVRHLCRYFSAQGIKGHININKTDEEIAADLRGTQIEESVRRLGNRASTHDGDEGVAGTEGIGGDLLAGSDGGVAGGESVGRGSNLENPIKRESAIAPPCTSGNEYEGMGAAGEAGADVPGYRLGGIGALPDAAVSSRTPGDEDEAAGTDASVGEEPSLEDPPEQKSAAQ